MTAKKEVRDSHSPETTCSQSVNPPSTHLAELISCLTNAWRGGPPVEDLSLSKRFF